MSRCPAADRRNCKAFWNLQKCSKSHERSCRMPLRTCVYRLGSSHHAQAWVVAVLILMHDCQISWNGQGSNLLSGTAQLCATTCFCTRYAAGAWWNMLHLQGISQLGTVSIFSDIKYLFPLCSETSLRGCIDLQCINAKCAGVSAHWWCRDVAPDKSRLTLM